MILLALLLQAPVPSSAAPPAGDVVVRAPLKPTPQTPATIVVEPAAMFIAASDRDNDGRTTRAELRDSVQQSFAAIDTAGTGKLRYLAFADWALRYLGDRSALPSPFETDRDGDGSVSLDELQDQFSRLYGRFDKDGGEGVSRAELMTFKTGPVDANGQVRGGPDRREGGRRRP